MGAVYVEDTRVPVTYVTAGPCVVTQVKTSEKDGYQAVQIGIGIKKIKNITKPLQGHLKSLIKDNFAPRYLREVKVESLQDLQKGTEVKSNEVFKVGDIVSATAVSKGKGFAGVVKRYHFRGGPKTHGQSDRQRHPGSIGATTTPGRVLKGKRMAGRMGGEQVTIKGLMIVSIDNEKGEMAVSGAVPGVTGGLLILKKIHSGKIKELVEETTTQVVEKKEESPAPEATVNQGETKKESEG